MATRGTPELDGLSLPQAALTAGIGLLIVGVAAPFAQFFVFPSLVVPASAGHTVQNLMEHRGLFLAGILAYFANYAFDVVVAWALYVLLAPVNRALSVLAFAFCLVYIAMGFAAVQNYVEVYRLLASLEVEAAIGREALDGQLHLRFLSYQFDWGFSLLVFGVVLLLRGYLVWRAQYLPTLLGGCLAIAGLGYIGFELGVLIDPSVDLSWLAATFVAEPVFMVWLLARGHRIRDPQESAALA